MKKFASAALAGAMALSMSATAFAASTTEVGMDGLADGATVEVTGTTQTATVKILVPATGDIVLNPYELDYTVEGAASPVQDQIISATQYIVNESNLPVKVSTKVTGTIEGADFATGSATAETDKKVNLNFNIAKMAAATGDPASPESKALAKTEVAFTDITMDKKGGSNPVIGYNFSGDASENPDTPWTTDDIVGATIAFTFKLEGGTSGGGGGGTTTYGVTSASCATGTFTVDKSTAAANDTVTVTANSPTTGGQTATVTVTKDSDSSSVSVTDNSDGTFTFTMPAEAVTVTVVYA